MAEETEAAKTKTPRGGCLTVFLILMFIANPAASSYFLLYGDRVSQASGIPAWALPVLAILSIVNVLLAIAVWNWKRIGVLGLAVNAVLILMVNVSIGMSMAQALLGLLGPLLLAALVKPRWHEFR